MTSRERRLVLSACVAIPTMLALRLAFPAWTAWATETRQEKRELVEEVAGTAARLDELPAQLDTLEARTVRLVELMPALVLGDPIREAARLETDLRARTEGVGATVESLVVAVDSMDARMASVRVTLQGVGDVVALSSLLRGFEEQQPVLSVRKLSVRPLDIHVPQHAVEEITFSVELEALALRRRSVDRS